MELWIRSQDKEKLVRIKALKLTSAGGSKYEISGLLIGFEYLGIYKSKARALEILDEIQNILQPRVFIEQPEIDFNEEDMIEKLSQNIVMNVNNKMNFELKNAGQVVYEMPKE